MITIPTSSNTCNLSCSALFTFHTRYQRVRGHSTWSWYNSSAFRTMASSSNDLILIKIHGLSQDSWFCWSCGSKCISSINNSFRWDSFHGVVKESHLNSKLAISSYYRKASFYCLWNEDLEAWAGDALHSRSSTTSTSRIALLKRQFRPSLKALGLVVNSWRKPRIWLIN